MIVLPYKRPPRPPTVAILTPQATILSEDGTEWAAGSQPQGTRSFVDYDTVRELIAAGHGEALCWNGEEIRWRDRRYEDGWRTRPTDVCVLKLPFPERPARTLAALERWRDWLASYGAVPGTVGSAAMSLLRATLQDDAIFCSAGERPPLRQTMGGRVELGAGGPGCYRGRLEQWDLPAAYASTIGGLRYGGRWYRTGSLPVVHEPHWWALDDRPVFCRARLRIGDGVSGPLLRRPRRRVSPLHFALSNLVEPRYPAGVTITGVWTWQEIEVAVEHGARLMELHETWVHLGGRHLFAPWWAAVQQGRVLPGLAGVLAKMTGNGLWGRFCMDVRVQGTRTVRSRARRGLQQRVLPRRGAPFPAHDLAEAVAGQNRSRLYGMMVACGDRLLSAHTDGVWTRELGEGAAGWRRKMEARRLDLIDPQTLRYFPRGRQARYVMAGFATKEQPEAFERLWRRGQSDGQEKDEDVGVRAPAGPRPAGAGRGPGAGRGRETVA